MKNQFYYTRTVTKNTTDGSGTQTEVKLLDTFNIDMVIRSVENEDGTRTLVLNDLHERLEDGPQFDKTRKKIVGYTKQRNTYQSEITLSKEDNERFINLTTL